MLDAVGIVAVEALLWMAWARMARWLDDH